MIQGFDEGIKLINNKPLPIDCLLMDYAQEQAPSACETWEKLHYHKYIELLYAVEGDFEVYINGETLCMEQGAAAIINAGELHATRRRSPKNTLLCIKFIPEILFSSEQSFTEIEYAIPYVFERFGFDRCFSRTMLCDTFLPQAFERIKDEHQKCDFGYELAIRAEVMRVFAWILRYWHHMQNDDRAQPLPGEAEVIRKAREYVDEHYAEATLLGAAEYCCLSYSYFSRLFSRCMRMSFSHYVNLKRINHSMKELVLTEKSITEIAMSAGFSSASYYIQTFRRMKNLSPKQFRKAFAMRQKEENTEIANGAVH